MCKRPLDRSTATCRPPQPPQTGVMCSHFVTGHQGQCGAVRLQDIFGAAGQPRRAPLHCPSQGGKSKPACLPRPGFPDSTREWRPFLFLLERPGHEPTGVESPTRERIFALDCTISPLHGRMAHAKRTMLSPGDIAIIKAEIKRLEKARRECNDGGIQKQIDVWIEELKKKLAAS